MQNYLRRSSSTKSVCKRSVLARSRIWSRIWSWATSWTSSDRSEWCSGSQLSWRRVGKRCGCWCCVRASDHWADRGGLLNRADGLQILSVLSLGIMTSPWSYDCNLLSLSDNHNSSSTASWAVGDWSWATSLGSGFSGINRQGSQRTSRVGQVTTVVEVLRVVGVGGSQCGEEGHGYGGGELHLEYVDRSKYDMYGRCFFF